MSEKSGIQSFRRCFDNGANWLLSLQNTDGPGDFAVDTRQYLIKAGAQLSMGNRGCFQIVAYSYEILVCDNAHSSNSAVLITKPCHTA